MCMANHFTKFQIVTIYTYLLFPFSDSWIHCNDSRMEKCNLGDVMAAQAYILFYTQIKRPTFNTSLLVTDNTAVTDSEQDTLEYSLDPEDMSEQSQLEIVNEHDQEGKSSNSDSDDVSPKRGRGRPRKRKYPSLLPASSEESSQEVTQKRGRGRPRKYGIGLGGSTQDLEDGEISFNFKNSSVPKYIGSKRAAESTEDRRKHLKRRKTVMW